MSVVVFKEIKPQRLNEDAMRLAFLTEMERISRDIQKDFEKTTRTWKNKPEFEVIKSLPRKKGDVEVLIGTDSVIYKFVDEGTKVRHAVMSNPFVSKSVPNVINSRRGVGGVVIVNKNINRPGIKARNFSKIIQKKWQKIFKRRMEKAMRQARKVSGHAI